MRNIFQSWFFEAVFRLLGRVMQTANAQNKSEPAAAEIGGRVKELARKAAKCEGTDSERKERMAKAV